MGGGEFTISAFEYLKRYTFSRKILTMVRLLTVQIIFFIGIGIIADSLAKLDDNKTSIDVNNHLKKIKTRRLAKAKKGRSTSSSSGERQASDNEDVKESLDMSSVGGASSDIFKPKKGVIFPKSSIERKGWRKWHRKCHKCPEDMMKKWRDPTIKWICGAYQRARRSFKSACMMHYRNCQDGTMFVQIYEGRCKNDAPGDPQPHGEHFFYDYRVALSGDTATSESDNDDSPDVSY